MFPWYKINFRHEDDYENAKFHLIWKINYFALIAMFAICVLTSQESIRNTIVFGAAAFVPLGNLLYMYKIRNYTIAIWVICFAGILFPCFTLIAYHEVMHIGDALWLIVAVCISYYGLGIRVGKFFLAATVIIFGLYIYLAMDVNIHTIRPLGEVDKIAFFIELAFSTTIIFAIISLFIRLGIQSEEKVRNINLELAAKNAVVTAQNQEKEILLKEIHHRVKNNLQVVSSLLNLQSYEVENKEVVHVLQEGKERIMTMALLHKMLYESADLNELNLHDYVKELSDNLKAGFGNQCNVIVDIKNIVIDVDTTLSLGLILNELLTNAFKYGAQENGEIRIACVEKQSNHFELTCADNGPGLPEGVSFENGKTLGLRLVKLLTRQINGNCEYNNVNGTQFVINFTNAEEREKID